MKKGLLLILSALCLVCVLSSCGCQHEWEVTEDTSSCTEVGQRVSVCKICNTTKTEKTGGTGHTLAHVDAKDQVSCGEPGVVEHYACSVCGKTFSDEAGSSELSDIRVMTLSHSTKATLAKKASCESAGTIAFWTCKDCGKFFSDKACQNEITEEEKAAPALGHNPTPVAKAEPTYETTGVEAHFKCSRCPKLFSDIEGKNEVTLESLTIAMKVCPGHQYGDWTLVDMKLYRLCPVCNVKQYVEAKPGAVVDGSGKRIATAESTFSLTAKGSLREGTFTVSAPVAGVYNVFFTGFLDDWKRCTLLNTTLGNDADRWQSATKVPGSNNANRVMGYDISIGMYLKAGDNALVFKTEGNESTLKTWSVLVTPGDIGVAATLGTEYITVSADTPSEITYADVKAKLTGEKAVYYHTPPAEGQMFNADSFEGSQTALLRGYGGGWWAFFGEKLVIPEDGFYMLGGAVTPYCIWSNNGVTTDSALKINLCLYDTNDTELKLEDIDVKKWYDAALEGGYAGYRCGDCYSAPYVELGVVYLKAGEYRIGLFDKGSIGGLAYVSAVKLAHDHIVENGKCAYCGETVD